jgi:hypothetical protein
LNYFDPYCELFPRIYDKEPLNLYGFL